MIVTKDQKKMLYNKAFFGTKFYRLMLKILHMAESYCVNNLNLAEEKNKVNKINAVLNVI